MAPGLPEPLMINLLMCSGCIYSSYYTGFYTLGQEVVVLLVTTFSDGIRFLREFLLISVEMSRTVIGVQLFMFAFLTVKLIRFPETALRFCQRPCHFVLLFASFVIFYT